MKFINLALLILQILLETKIFPDLSSDYVNPKLFMVSGMTLGAFLISLELSKRSKFTIFGVLTMDAFLGSYLCSLYYPNKPQFDVPLILFIYYTGAISLYYIKSKDFDEMLSSDIILPIFKFLCCLCFSNMYVDYFELYHAETVANFEFNFKFFTSYSEKFIVDYVIIFGAASVCDLINFYYSKEETNFSLRNIIKRIIFKIINCAIFFTIFNSSLADSCYDLLFKHLSKPYNILIYNMVGYNPLIRMKVIYAIIFNIFY